MTEETKDVQEEKSEPEFDLNAALSEEYDKLEAGDAPEDEDKPEKQEATDESEEAPAEGAEEDPAEVAAPEHWSNEDKEAFKNLPAEAQPIYLEARKSLESGYNQKFEDLASERKSLEAYKGVAELFAPYQQQLDQAGTTPEAYMRQLIATAQALRADPRSTLTRLAQAYQVNFQEEMEDDLDPVLKARLDRLESQNQQLATSFNQTTQTQATASQQQTQQELEVFFNAKDDQGNARFPGAEGLRAKIGYELQTLASVPGESAQDLLSRAYDNVKWTDPTLRQSIIEADAKAKQDSAEAERKAEVEKAKKAGRNIKSKSASVDPAPKTEGSLRDQLSAGWDEMANA